MGRYQIHEIYSRTLNKLEGQRLVFLWPMFWDCNYTTQLWSLCRNTQTSPKERKKSITTKSYTMTWKRLCIYVLDTYMSLLCIGLASEKYTIFIVNSMSEDTEIHRISNPNSSLKFVISTFKALHLIFNFYICITFMLVYQHLFCVQLLFNNVSYTSIHYNIVVLTW